jgi:muramidase (phage lysozyme)
VERSARCIAKHESWSAGLWKAENPISTASGAFQFIDSTWQAVARRAGIGTQYRHASDAPPRIQAAVFAHQALNYGLYPWKGTNCPGTG